MIINMNGAKAPETPSPVLQEKTITPETLPTVVGADEGYTGLSQVTVNPDTNLKAENIRSGKTIFGVGGTFVGTEVQGEKFTQLFNKTITSLTTDDLIGVTKIPDRICERNPHLTEVSLPDSITEIGFYGFYNCQNLETVNLSQNLVIIRDDAFSQAYKLTSITIPPSCTSITNGAFSNSGLTSFEFPEGTTSINTEVFAFCKSLTTVIIPSTVTWMYNDAFLNCKALTSLIMKPTTPPNGNIPSVLNGVSPDLIITVPKGSLETYQAHSVWGKLRYTMVEANE